MTKFALYYGITRKDDNKEIIALKDRKLVKQLKLQCKKDATDPKMAEKYSCLVLASDFGVLARYKLALAEKKAAPKKNEKKEK